MSKKLNYFLFLLLFLTSCQMAETTYDDSTFSAQTTIGHSSTIPVDSALNSLQLLINQLYPETKGNHDSFQIKNVDVVGSISETRSNLSLDSLLYLVNFANDAGFAVVSADKRIPDDILALSESGSINALCFKSAHQSKGTPYFSKEYNEWAVAEDNNGDETDHNSFIASEIMNYAMGSIINTVDTTSKDINNGDTDNDNEHSTTHITRFNYSGWSIDYCIAPIVRTHWHQDAPFNMNCLNNKGQRVPTGCVTTAVAQIIAHNARNYGEFHNSHNQLMWSYINQYENVDSPGSGDVTSVEDFCSYLFNKCKIKSDSIDGYTFSLPHKAKNAFQDNGYTNVKEHFNYGLDSIRTMLSNGKPVFISGISSSTSHYFFPNYHIDGHAWIIDGLLVRKRTIEEIDLNTNEVLSQLIEYRNLVHCNWGWTNGGCNGYFADGIFDLSHKADKYDESDTDRDSTSVNYNFDSCLNYITYDLQ